ALGVGRQEQRETALADDRDGGALVRVVRRGAAPERDWPDDADGQRAGVQKLAGSRRETADSAAIDLVLERREGRVTCAVAAVQEEPDRGAVDHREQAPGGVARRGRRHGDAERPASE